MVTKWGLSEKMGPLLYDEGGEEVFLGGSAPATDAEKAADRSGPIGGPAGEH
jgi:ATP-dependent Zn protease